MRTETLTLLKQAGWHKGRKLNIEEDIKYLEKEGYQVHKPFMNFNAEFGGLIIICTVGGAERVLSFKATNTDRIEFDSVIQEDYPRITGSKHLIPIGVIDGQSVLVIDENSIIYSLYGGEVAIIGKSIEEALDNLCNLGWRKFEEYPQPDWWYTD